MEAGVTAGGGLIGGGGGVTAASRQPATAGALLLPKATHGSACQGQSQQQQQQTHKPPSQRTHQGAALQQHGVRPVLGDRQAQGGSRGESAGSHELQGEEHEPLDRAEEDDEDDEDALLALCEAEERLGLGLGGKEGRWVAEGAGAGRGEGWEEEVEGDDDATQYDRGTAGTEEEGGGAGMEYDEDVPVLPRAFSGVFAGVGGRGAVGAGAARGSAAGGSGVVGAGAAARAAAAAPSVRTVASFAAKVSGVKEDLPSQEAASRSCVAGLSYTPQAPVPRSGGRAASRSYRCLPVHASMQHATEWPLDLRCQRLAYISNLSLCQRLPACRLPGMRAGPRPGAPAARLRIRLRQRWRRRQQPVRRPPVWRRRGVRHWRRRQRAACTGRA